jgi:hypothetical protein
MKSKNKLHPHYHRSYILRETFGKSIAFHENAFEVTAISSDKPNLERVGQLQEVPVYQNDPSNYTISRFRVGLEIV